MGDRRYTSPPILIPVALAKVLHRAEIVVDRLDEAGPSFEARVFLDNTKASERTPPTSENGYVGSIHVYGYGLMSDEPRRERDDTSATSPFRAPLRRSVPATEAVRAATARGRPVTVTVVTVPYQGSPEALDVDLSPLRVSIEIDQPREA